MKYHDAIEDFYGSTIKKIYEKSTDILLDAFKKDLLANIEEYKDVLFKDIQKSIDDGYGFEVRKELALLHFKVIFKIMCEKYTENVDMEINESIQLLLIEKSKCDLARSK